MSDLADAKRAPSSPRRKSKKSGSKNLPLSPSKNKSPPLSPSKSEGMLDWRMPADRSYADWRIEIVVPEDGAYYRVYDVHKHKLDVGPRRCRYFQPIFQTFHETTTANNKTTSSSCMPSVRIQLPKLAAEAFPSLLDYVYGVERDTPLEITTETATALLYLADFFVNERMLGHVQTFWKQDVTLDNCHVYYEHSRNVGNDDLVLKEVVVGCCSFVHLIPPDHPLLPLVDEAGFWTKLLEMSFELYKSKPSVAWYNGIRRLIPLIVSTHISPKLFRPRACNK